MAHTTVFCCAENMAPAWCWVESQFINTDVDFEFARCPARRFDQVLGILNLRRLISCFEAMRMVQRIDVRVVAHGPTLVAWCAKFARLFCSKGPIVAHSFNFTELQSALKRTVFWFVFSLIDRFVIFFQIEKRVYSKAFDIPVDRFNFVLWGFRTPKVEPADRPIESRDYVLAIGGIARDYGTFVEAARTLPDMRFIWVVNPKIFTGLHFLAMASSTANSSIRSRGINDIVLLSEPP
jgi:hypothetical protein